jgi:hypothetical protein
MSEEQNKSEPASGAPPSWRFVHVRQYSEQFDLTGRDLISMLDHTKEEVSTMVGSLAAKSEMATEELPTEFVTTMSGEIADEVHEWPNVTLGTDFRHLMLQFLAGRLVGIRWSFDKPVPIRKKAWWRFW